MQCLDDQSPYSLAYRRTHSDWLKEEGKVANKVADTSNSQRRGHFAKGKAMSRQSVTLLHSRAHFSPRFFNSSTASRMLSFALFSLFLATFVESAALHSLKPSSLHPESDDIAFCPLQPVLALNSSVVAHGTLHDLHRLLAPLTDETEHENLEALVKSAQIEDQSKVHPEEIRRSKRDVSSNDETNTTK